MELEESLLKNIELRKTHLGNSLVNWGVENYRTFPWRENRTPYSVLVSEILLKRTTASAAKRVFQEFMLTYPNVETLSTAKKEDLRNLLKKIGYHKRRAVILLEIANFVLDRFKGKIPCSKEDLREIPNVGQYTAGAILSFGYEIPSAMVDSNIERIIRRLFFKSLREKSFRTVQQVAEQLAPEISNQNYNYALLDFGALVCTYGLPKCGICPITEFCDYYLAGNPYRGR